MKTLRAVIILAISVLAYCFESTPARSQQVYRETIMLQTDRPLYHAGEMVWFSMFVFDGSGKRRSQLSKLAYVELVDSSGVSVNTSIIQLQKGTGAGSIELPHGLKPSTYRLVAYTRWMRNFRPASYSCRFLFVANGYYSPVLNLSTNLNGNNGRSNAVADIVMDSSQVRTRAPIAVKILISDNSGKPASANIAVSIYRNDLGATVPIEAQPVKLSHDHLKAHFKFEFEPEPNGQWITARIEDTRSGKPVPAISAYLVIPGYTSGFYNDRSDSSGVIRFLVNDPVACDSMIMLVNHAENATYSVVPADPFIKRFGPLVTSSSKNYPISITRQRNHFEVEKAFNADSRISLSAPIYDSTPFYGQHDLIYYLDDYTRFPTMEEVFREYVQLVSVRKNNGKFSLNVFNEPAGEMFDTNPLILLDGYPIFDANDLFAFDPLKVRSIEVVTRQYFRGSSTFNGIMSLSTYSRNFNSFKIAKGATIIKNSIVEGEKKYNGPVYETLPQKLSRKPDFRHLLLWEPSLNIANSGNSTLTCYSSDADGDFIIEVSGFTNDGEPVYARKMFSVVHSPMP